MTILAARTVPDLTDAACRTPAGQAAHDNAISHDSRTAYRAAKAVCEVCPLTLRTACLRWALDTGEPNGVYGGLDPRQRAALAAGIDPVDPPTLGPCTGCGRPLLPPGTLSHAPKPLASLWRAQGYVTAADGTNGKGCPHIRHVCTGCTWTRRRKAAS